MHAITRLLTLTSLLSTTSALAGDLPIPVAAPAAMQPAVTSGAWWADVHADLVRREYDAVAMESAVTAEATTWQAPNRAQNFRTYFTRTGIELVPRDRHPDEAPARKWCLQLCAWGRTGALQPAEPASISASNNRVEYHRHNLVEWYLNDNRGLEQGFTIPCPPPASHAAAYSGNASQIRLEFSVDGTTAAVLDDECTVVEFFAPGGARVIRFAELHAFDATNMPLKTHFEWTGASLAIVVFDAGAQYPLTIDPLATTPSWVAESNQSSANFGASVATAGDVNGDGYSDVIVGARGFDNGQNNEGRAFVFYGSAAGLSATADWTAESNLASAQFGHAVATAGDVNGDGYSDVIVGSYQYNNGLPIEGRAFVFHGSATGLSPTANWSAQGNQASAFFGFSVAPAGDVNGDGYGDVIIGADGYDNGELNEGRAYLYYGSEAGLSATAGWMVEGNQQNAQMGSSVATAGDVNGDGYSDVLVAAPFYDNGQADEGRVLVFFGAQSGLSTVANWTMEIDIVSARFGESLSSAGDVNGDGYGDVIIGASRINNGQTSEGRAFAYYGSATGLALTPDWSAEGNQVGAMFGNSVGLAGDVNGDGYGDVIVGAVQYENGEFDEGRAYVYQGSASGLSSNPSWSAESEQSSAWFGISAATAGDVNGDGFSDVIVGAHQYDAGQSNEGRAYVYLGSAGGLSLGEKWTAESNQIVASYGHAVASAGDVNGDGYCDVIVGAPDYDNSETDEGATFVYLGSDSGISTIHSWSAEGDQAGANFGDSVGSAGDVNGDGFSDVIVGAARYDNGEIDEGRAFVYHGSATGLSIAPDWTSEGNQPLSLWGVSVATAGDVNGDGFSDVVIGAEGYSNDQASEGRAAVYLGSPSGLSASPAWTAEGNSDGANFGHRVNSAGDVNHDGYSDLIVGAVSYSASQTLSQVGRVQVFHGSAAGLFSSPNWTAVGTQAGEMFGSAVAGAGDVNGDRFNDVIVGATGYGDGVTAYGGVFVYFGGQTGLSAQPNWSEPGDQPDGRFGASVGTAGDVNGDGFSDIIVGAPGQANGQASEGRAFVFLGAATGPGSSNWTVEGDQAQSELGSSVASAGDVNGDGYSDVIIGAPLYSNGQANEGRAISYYGNEGGGKTTRPRQLRTDGVTRIESLGMSDSATQFRIAATLRTFVGRTRMSMQYEVKPLGVSFDGTGLNETDSVDSGPASAVDVNHVVSGLSSSKFYHWRLRSHFDAVKMPFQRNGPWITPANNGWNETDVRMFCPVRLGDMNCDCALTVDDIAALVLALVDPAGHSIAHPGCNLLRGDMQPDGRLDGADLQQFVELLLP